MSQSSKKTPAAPRPVAASIPSAPKEFAVPLAWLWLCAAVLIVYYPAFNFGFTELDDAIFIRDKHEFNEHYSNIITAFRTGLFGQNDIYYRPLLLVSFLLNFKMSEISPEGYHVVNVLLHLASVVLLYFFFLKINLKQWIAFTLALIFAIHPVLSQAVAWIPGRNDTMLAIFILSFFITSINFSRSGKWGWLAVSIFFLACSFFTKETAVFAAPAAFVLLVVLLKKPLFDRNNIIQYVGWIVIFLLWYFVRAAAISKNNSLAAGAVFHDFIQRIPLIFQYLGKFFLPVNLNVFPTLDDTVTYYGIIAVAILAGIIFLAKNKDWRMIGAGFAVFFLFLLPVLFVPTGLNDQTFEHRLYLPVIGLLMVLSQTVLFRNGLKETQVFAGCLALVLVLGIVNYNHQQKFSDPLTFWQAAKEGSPHSAYAVMMYAARLGNRTSIASDKPDEVPDKSTQEADKKESRRLMRYAYSLNPHEKYLNFYMGTMLQDEDSVLESGKYLLAEQKISDYYECDFYLARVDLEGRNDPLAAAKHLERYLSRDNMNKQAYNNLLLIYINTKQKEKAQTLIGKMKTVGIAVAGPLQEQVNAMP